MSASSPSRSRVRSWWCSPAPPDWPVEQQHRVVVNGTRVFEVGEILGLHSYQPELRVVAEEMGL
jgi:hypothetical protein